MVKVSDFKVFDRDGNYQGCGRHSYLLVCAAYGLGEGATVRNGRRKRDVIFTVDETTGDSWDKDVETLLSNLKRNLNQHGEKG